MKVLVAVVGMCGSGKSEVVNFLVGKGYAKVYFGDVTFEAMQKENLEINPINEKYMREKIRAELGMSAYAILNLPKIKNLYAKGSVVIESMYSWDELKVLKEEFGDMLKVIAVITSKSIRYERLAQREFRPLTYAEAQDRDISEIEHLAKGGPIAYADYYLLNDGTLEDLQVNLEQILKRVEN